MSHHDREQFSIYCYSNALTSDEYTHKIEALSDKFTHVVTTPPELFDSEFFGHRRGAFTGAEREHTGIFLAATNRAPDSQVEARELRADLYYRLRGFEIHLPPLRERLEDIPMLARHFLAHSGKQLSSAAVDALLRCAWPGNVRQLRNTLARACAVACELEIDVQHLDLMAPAAALSRARSV